MARGRWRCIPESAALAVLLVLCGSRAVRADGGDDELRARIEANRQRIAALNEQLFQPLAPTDGHTPSVNPDEDAVRKMVDGYLQEQPGAGTPAGVQIGYFTDAGFVLRSAPDAPYIRWDDEGRIPFELRTRIRLNLAYNYYKSTDRTNHFTGQPLANAPPDFSQLMVKRAQLIEEGTLFDPDLRFRFSIHGDTRGLPASVAASPYTPSAALPVGGSVIVGNEVRTNEAWIAYDFHGRPRSAGPGADGPDGPTYRPTFTLIAGKRKAFFGLEEYLGNANEQFVELNMADLYFDADDDNLSILAGFQVKALDDRFFLEATVTDGSTSLAPNALLDDLPGFIAGFWYDFGGSWDPDKKAWDLFGPSVCDMEYSCRPVLRVGGSMNLVPMDRRSLYGDAEQGRIFVTPGAPGGTRLINVLNGGITAPVPAGPQGPHAVDAFDAYSFNAFAAAKYRGFSLLNEWWLRDLTGFRATPAGNGVLLYQDSLGPGGTAANALFPAHRSLIDYGSDFQAGYFLIPRKLEAVARWSWVRGESGNINGAGAFTTTAVPGVAAPVHVVSGAFRSSRQANECTIGLNYYFKRQQLKWQSDVGVYQGGNPANEGVTYPGFLTGVDGCLVRTQLSLSF